MHPFVKASTPLKRTTRQHPPAIIVLPHYIHIYHFTPIQFPPHHQSPPSITTHFHSHPIHHNLLKLHILAHHHPT
ncbi:hypothetical protein, partial [Staphylococcus epidermidis]|uniref:hypothetical protein n=1 Tax=Staphylococcus epidermidis TaxID=1282 RepID=UPI0021B19FDA